MATTIKRIEKDFVLKVLYDDQIPMMYLRNRNEYFFTVAKPSKDEIYLKSNHPVPGLKVRRKMNLIFDFRGQIVTFTAEIVALKDDIITVITPEFLYKDNYLYIYFDSDGKISSHDTVSVGGAFPPKKNQLL